MKRYDPKSIEPRWQKFWDENQTYKADLDSPKQKYLGMSMFNYPSGAGIHIGHAMNYTISDVMARFKRQQGYESYHPVGWDAFGLPAENYAIKSGVSPQASMKAIIPSYHKQYKAMGWSNDWSKEIATHEPAYYKWTQWIFSEMYRGGLAYQDARMQWWCTKCQTVLANEQVIDGKCWRHDSPDDPEVNKKEVKQWFFKITDYADELLEATDALDWTETVKLAQKNWIGKSKGAEVTFTVDGSDETITVFTTRPDTLYGATFLVMAPEHEQLLKLVTPEQKAEVEAYIKTTAKKTEVERQASKEKTGVFTGAYVINPINDEKIPVWVADYVLAGYGTGAIMAVPAHDERDNEFAKKFELPVVPVVARLHIDEEHPTKPGVATEPRNVVQTLVKHPNEDTYLRLKLKGWDPVTYSLPIGGVDEGEDPVTAVKREFEEETGFTDYGDMVQIAPPYIAEFYHELKKVNRRAYITSFYTELKSLEQREVSDEEKAKHELEWVTLDELHTSLHGQGVQHVVELFKNGEQAESGEGVMINSGEYSGMSSSDMREKIVADLAKKSVAAEKTTYKIRDWSVSRQRYWGAPIPIVHCTMCFAKEYTGPISMSQEISKGELDVRRSTVESKVIDEIKEPGLIIEFTIDGEVQAYAKTRNTQSFGSKRLEIEYLKKPVLVPDEQLPVVLPELTDFAPSGDGRSALARATEWLNAECPKCGGPAQRETDTLDTYIDSSWYMIRYTDPQNESQPFDKLRSNKWMPVDFYNGADHATAHMIYARFITRFFHKQGVLDNPEPFKRFLFNGKVTAADGQMFSKSKGNGVDPLEIINSGYGADALRTYLMFAAPLDLWIRWDPQGVPGTYRFLNRVFNLVQEFLSNSTGKIENSKDEKVLKIIHPAIKKVTADLEDQKYNTAIATMMGATNDLYALKVQDKFADAEAWRFALESLVMLIAPFAPHTAEELWHDLGHTDSVNRDHWPAWEDKYLVSDEITYAVQVNGKLRGTVTVPSGATQEDVVAAARDDEKVKAHLVGEPKKIIFVPKKLVSFVV